jgi:hypothetical protein
VIWQYWETRGDKPRFVDGLHTLVRRNSGVNVVLVTPETLANYLPDIEPNVLRIANPTHKSDMIRTRLVLKYGGMWLDSDAVVLRDLNWLFDRLADHEFIGFNDGGMLQAARPFVRVNCFLSRPGGRIVREWVHEQQKKLPQLTFEWSEIGAAMLNPICLANRNLIDVQPFKNICPIPWNSVEAFGTKNDAMVERILRDCLMVMLSNATLRTKYPAVQGLTVEEIAMNDDVLGGVMRAALAADPRTMADARMDVIG